jgi:hypothetical protein
MVCATLPDRDAKPEGLHVCVVTDDHVEHVCESCGLTWAEQGEGPGSTGPPGASSSI